MNNKVRELMESAGFTNSFANPDDGFEVVFIDEIHTTECLHRFARLLIDECVRVAVKSSNIDATHEAWFEIQKHFGVEE
jgi:hypothetical protein